MKVSEGQFTVGKSKQALGYSTNQGVNLQPIAQGINVLGDGLARVAAEQKAKANQMERFKATAALTDYNTQVELEQEEFRKQAAPDDTAFAMKAVDVYVNRESEFIKTLPPDLQEEFRARVADTRQRVTLNAHDFQDKQLTNYYTSEVKKRGELAATKISEDPDSVEQWRADLRQMVINSDMPETNKVALVQQMDEFIETSAYRTKTKQNRLSDAQYSDELVTATRQAAQEIGADPIDLLTYMSYETGGKLSTGTRGGAGNRHIGLIQFGKEEQKKYGVHEGQTVSEQMRSVVAFLKDRGFKPGMSREQLYATINAGNPYALGASDANNGGMPGNVVDKVNSPQMAEHRAKAIQIADGKYVIPDDLDVDPRFQNVPYEARIAARNDSNAEVNQLMAQMKEERTTARNAFNNELYKQLEYGPLSDANKLVDDAVAAGKLRDYDDLKKATDIIKRREKDANKYNEFLTRIEQGLVLDPTDADNKKGMNKFFGETGAKELNARNEQYVTDVLVPVFQKTQMLPPDAVGILRALANSNDARQMFYALKALNTLELANPDAYASQVTETLRKKADRYEALAGVSDEKELIEDLRAPKTAQDMQARQIKRDEAKKILSSGTSDVTFETVSDAFDGAALPAGPKGTAMQNEWMALVTENYASGRAMTMEMANELAIKQLKRVWGNTEIGGKTMMRLPPEKFIGTVGGSREFMETQIRGELGLMDDERPVLISDTQTEQEVNGGKPPSYQVFIEKDGVLRQVMSPPGRDRFGTPLPKEGNGREVLPYRHFFKITEADKSVENAQAVAENKQARLQYLERMTMPFVATAGLQGPNGVTQIPAALIAERDALRAEVDDTKKVVEDRKAASARQYETAAGARYKELMRQFDPINNELMNWTENAESFPQIGEWEKLYDELERLKPIMAQEAADRRTNMEIK